MTKKTNGPSMLAEPLPASLVQPAAAATLEHPTAGGSYTRQADGTLVANPDAAMATPAAAPACHFDQPPSGDAAA